MAKIEDFNTALKDLSPMITSDDKKKCNKQKHISVFTINKYLRGEGENINTAQRIIEFMKKRIASREKLLTA